jgi:D-glycero-alpha-D-manno-heptose-7-phosphate kinase
MLGRFRSDRRYLSYTVDLPLGAGMGASAAQTVLWVALTRSVIDNAADRRTVAESACAIQALLGTLRGCQDAFASALGGVTHYHQGPPEAVERIDLDLSVQEELDARMVLAWSGERGRSAQVLRLLAERAAGNDARLLDGLRDLRRIAKEMKSALQRGDVDAVAASIDEHWRRQREIEPAAASPAANDLESRARGAGAVAVKACGIAGGMLLILAKHGYHGHLFGFLRARGVQVYTPRLDNYGVHLRKA